MVDEKQVHDYSGVLGVPLLRKVLDKGRILINKMPTIEEIQIYRGKQINILPPEFKDLDAVPEEFPVMYSEKLNTITKEFKVV